MYTTKSLFTRAKYNVNQTLTWKMLSEDQCEELLMTTFELLERTGAEVQSPEALALLKEAGCFVKENRVTIPSAKLEWALRVAPSRLTLCDRNGKRAILMETDNVHYGPGFGSGMTLDMETETPRQTVKADVANTALVANGLENINFLMDNGTPTDVPVGTAPIHSFEALVSNSTKPVLQPVCTQSQAQAVIDMAVAVKGCPDALRQNPFVALYVTADEPLLHGKEQMDIIMTAAKNGVPVAYVNHLITGLTAPEQSAGALVVALANALVGLLVSQLTAEGAPYITGGFFTVNDTKNNIKPLGAPEVSLLGTGFANILRSLRVPCLGYGGGTDSKTTDAQLGLEAAFSLLHAGLAGTNMIFGAGQMENAAIGSPFLMVMADEIIGMTKRMMEGVEVNEDKLARGVIDAVQPGGHYISEPHTMYYFKKEQFWPKLMNRNRIDDWMAAGSKTLGQRTAEKTRSLLSLAQPAALPEETVQKLADIVAKADSALQ